MPAPCRHNDVGSGTERPSVASATSDTSRHRGLNARLRAGRGLAKGRRDNAFPQGLLCQTRLAKPRPPIPANGLVQPPRRPTRSPFARFPSRKTAQPAPTALCAATTITSSRSAPSSPRSSRAAPAALLRALAWSTAAATRTWEQTASLSSRSTWGPQQNPLRIAHERALCRPQHPRHAPRVRRNHCPVATIRAALKPLCDVRVAFRASMEARA